MQLSDFDYHLPTELIAAYPPKDRPSAKLLYVPRSGGDFSHHIVRDLPQFFQAGDVLVLNNTKVLPARLFGTKSTGGRVEALLLKEIASDQWETLLRPGGRIRKGMKILFGRGEACLAPAIEAEVLDDPAPDSGQRTIRFLNGNRDMLRQIGHIPLPPYIDRPDTEIDREMYQTVFAKNEGAVASPTAGLHFDEPLLNALQQKGVEIVYVTLHTSYGTFQPIAEEDISKHRMFAEEFEVTQEAANKINQALDENRRIIACGTTTVRTLETCANPHPGPLPKRERGNNDTPSPSLREKAGMRVQAGKGRTRLFVYPPYEFKIVKGLITNFHLPKSSLLLLVAAFAGMDRMFAAYDEAIRHQYRFYSYGDATLIV